MSDEIQKPEHEAEVSAKPDELAEEELDNVAGGFTLIERGITDGTSNTFQGGTLNNTFTGGIKPGGV